MTDPLDTAAIRKRAQHAADWRHLWANEDLQRGDNLAISAMRAAKQLAVDDVPALLARIAELEAEQQNGAKSRLCETGSHMCTGLTGCPTCRVGAIRCACECHPDPISDTTGDQQ